MASNDRAYLKAGLLTILVIMAGMFVIQTIDSNRAADLQRNTEYLYLENEQSRVMMLYTELLGSDNESLCQYLNQSTALHMGRTFELISKMESYKKNAVLGDELDRIWFRYTLANAELYLDILAINKRCGVKQVVPIAFFYSTKCGECQLQGQVLDVIVNENPKIRVFAFPVDGSYAFVELLKARYSVDKIPAIVIDDSVKMDGLKKKEEILAKIKG